MTTPTGQISMSDVNVENGNPSTQVVYFSNQAVRDLALRPSGEISMSHMRGKTRVTCVLGAYSVTGHGQTEFGNGRAYTTNVGIQASGGSGFTYEMERVSGTAFALEWITYTGPTWVFRFRHDAPPGTYTAVYRGKATNSIGNFDYTPNISVTMIIEHWINPGGA